MIDSRLLPLALLNADDEAVEGITRFQKLVFKAQKEVLDSEEYDFEPLDYGPFSKELYNDIDNLVAEGYVECDIQETENGNTKQVYSITDEGKRIVERFVDKKLENEMDGLEQLKQRDNSKPILELLSEIYSEYPEMAENSVLDIA